MNRLNDKIADNREKKNKLENENYNIESEFIEKLKDMEKESVYLEVKILYSFLNISILHNKLICFSLYNLGRNGPYKRRKSLTAIRNRGSREINPVMGT